MAPHDFGVAFTVWAAVVALVGGAIVYELARLRVQFTELSTQMNKLTVHFEHRLTRVETKVGLQVTD